MSKNIFVYGTLKEGFSAHELLQGATLVMKDYVLQGYQLHSGLCYPVVKPGDPNNFVVGELYRVSDDIQEKLDWYEGHPRLFKRTPVVGDPDIEYYDYQGQVRADTPTVEDGIYRQDY